MSKTLREFSTTVTVTDGVGSLSLATFLPLRDAGGYLEQVLVKAPTTVATFTIELIDSSNYSKWDSKGTGKLNDIPKIPCPKDTYTLKISEATDGIYNVKLLLREEW